MKSQQKLQCDPILSKHNYKFIRKLGQGAFGISYLYTHETKPPLVVKEIAIKNKEHKTQVDREIAILKSIKHNCQKLLCIDEHGMVNDNNTMCILTRYRKNTITLDKYIKKYVYVWKNALSIMTSILDTIITLHKLGVVHRDIKPDNILINPNTLETFLIDFGLSCRKDTIEKCANKHYIPYLPPKYLKNMITKKHAPTFEIEMQNDYWAFAMVCVNILLKKKALIVETLGDILKYENYKIADDVVSDELHKKKRTSQPYGYGGIEGYAEDDDSSEMGYQYENNTSGKTKKEKILDVIEKSTETLEYDTLKLDNTPFKFIGNIIRSYPNIDINETLVSIKSIIIIKPKLVVFDFDKTLISIHTCGRGININKVTPEHFTDPEYLKTVLYSLKKKNIPFGIASFGRKHLILEYFRQLLGKKQTLITYDNIKTPYDIIQKHFLNDKNTESLKEILSVADKNTVLSKYSKLCASENRHKSNRIYNFVKNDINSVDELSEILNMDKEYIIKIFEKTCSFECQELGERTKYKLIQYLTNDYNIKNNSQVHFFDDSLQNIEYAQKKGVISFEILKKNETDVAPFKKGQFHSFFENRQYIHKQYYKQTKDSVGNLLSYI